MPSYELMFLVDPRLSDDEVAAVSQEFKEVIGSHGGEITKEESWGKRRLAYTINKLNDARYLIFNIETEGGNFIPEVEQRLKQSDKVLRYLTVRTDRGRLRERPSRVAVAAEAEEATP